MSLLARPRSVFFRKCRSVIPRPLKVAARYDTSSSPGRTTWIERTRGFCAEIARTFGPSAVAMGSLRRGSRRTSSPHECKLEERGHHDIGERERQEQLPAEVHQLVSAEARQRPADQQLEPAEERITLPVKVANWIRTTLQCGKRSAEPCITLWPLTIDHLAAPAELTNRALRPEKTSFCSARC